MGVNEQQNGRAALPHVLSMHSKSISIRHNFKPCPRGHSSSSLSPWYFIPCLAHAPSSHLCIQGWICCWSPRRAAPLVRGSQDKSQENPCSAEEHSGCVLPTLPPLLFPSSSLRAASEPPVLGCEPDSKEQFTAFSESTRSPPDTHTNAFLSSPNTWSFSASSCSKAGAAKSPGLRFLSPHCYVISSSSIIVSAPADGADLPAPPDVASEPSSTHIHL